MSIACFTQQARHARNALIKAVALIYLLWYFGVCSTPAAGLSIFHERLLTLPVRL